MTHQTALVPQHQDTPDLVLGHYAAVGNYAAAQFGSLAIHIRTIAPDAYTFRMRQQEFHRLFNGIGHIDIVAGLNAHDLASNQAHSLVGGEDLALVGFRDELQAGVLSSEALKNVHGTVLGGAVHYKAFDSRISLPQIGRA